MWRHFLTTLTTRAAFCRALLIALCFVGPAAAQEPGAAPARAEAAQPVLQYTMAFLATAAVMVLVCMPARRS